ncbi:hypothetical protein M514_06209 [Trichuris suis]|uniref:Secreted protein n=1 Tax=Trichuris suis TaxID=68888 RepID=A0A085M6Q3_9BILA|nr:hypothetical protein M513_06209 [Trichuris suis]KFD63713.1 hypothetical protein M514_06209 [Trichuris suis]
MRIHFFTALLLQMKSGFCMTIGGDCDSGWTQMNHVGSFPSRLCTCERAMLIFWFHIAIAHFKISLCWTIG